MAKLTDAQKAEQKKLKAIPNKEMKDAIASINAFLKEQKMDEVKLEKSKGATVAGFAAAINGLLEAGKAEEIPENVATFYNDHIVGDDEDTSGDGTSDKGADTGKNDTKNPAGDKPKKPRKTKAEIQARYDAISAMIKTGKHTKKEIVEVIAPKFPDVTVSTISTFVQDCMNVKYNKLPKLTVKGEDGKLSFSK